MVSSWTQTWLLAEIFVLAVTVPTITRLIRSRRTGPRLGSSAIEGAPSRRISVIVPARNEAQRIEPLLTVLAKSSGILEVLVVDDESTDETAEIAARLGAQVVAVSNRPAGWVGKTWALQQGILAARGEWVVALDADTRPDPALAENVIRWADDHQMALTTVAGSFECPTLGAQFVHPALLTTLIYRYGRPSLAPASRTLANGQCMAFRRTEAISCGFFERVRGELIEDVALARLLRREGKSVAMVDGADHLTVRMFEDLPSTIRGWGRSISMAGVESHPRLLAQLVAVGFAQVLPVVLIVTGIAPIMGTVLLAMRIGTLFGTTTTYPGRRWTFWLSPIADVVAWSVLAHGVIRHLLGAPVVWRGRSYASSPSRL